MITVPNQLVGAQESSAVTLECHSEAFPKSINYWTKDNDEIITKDTSKYWFNCLKDINYRIGIGLYFRKKFSFNIE